MRKALVVASCVASAVLLVGCGGSAGSSATTSAASSSSPVPPTPSATLALAQEKGISDQEVKDKYAFAMRMDTGSAFAGLPDASVVSLGWSICYAFDHDEAFTTVLYTLTSSGGGTVFTTEQAAQMIGLTVAALCPQHNDILNSASNG